jgi:hypothetical protein
MRLRVDHLFAREARASGLRFGCPDCVHRSPRTGQCAHDWPDEAHKDTRLEVDDQAPREISFCKEFELI